jgi:mycothiol system anti-sigma-R factor
MDDLRRLLGGARDRPPDEEPQGATCHEALERVFEWLDGELDSDLESRVGEHLRTCARCYPVLRFEQAFREALKRAPSGEAVPKEVRASVLTSLEKAGLAED